jgi:hypothetical protein
MPSIRVGESRHRISNSGLEVWLYDDSQRDAIRRTGAMDFTNAGADPNFDELTQDGQIIGYSLCTDDELDVSVIVGKPLTGEELAQGRWLEPQQAWLRLPSGVLRIDSNDSCPLLSDDPLEQGASVIVQPGTYTVTLYRVDDEALGREQMSWDGPQEVIVLTRGGSSAQAATTLLPFEPRRDLSWVGQFTITGSHANCLVWFYDAWDSFFVNLDAKAVASLGITPGTYVRVTAPDAGVELTSVFDLTWKDGASRPPPATGSLPDEYGYCAVIPVADWNGAEALFGRRVRTAKRIDDRHIKLWMPAAIDRLDLEPAAAVQVGSREFRDARLHELQYYEPDFLPLILSDVLGDIDDDESFEAIIGRVDQAMKTFGLRAPADYMWIEKELSGEREFACRLYSGSPEMIGAIQATDGSIEIMLLSELADGGWVVTGLADFTETRLTIGKPRPSIRLQNLDEPMKKIHAAHAKALKTAGPLKPAPPAGLETLAAFDRFLVAAFN